jgi:hypothetical protein
MSKRRSSSSRLTGIERRDATGSWPAIEIRSSPRRRKTATAWWEGATLVVAMPGHVREPDRTELIAWLVERASRRRPSMTRSDPELLERALEMAARYELGVEPIAVRFVSNQRRRWGSCTPETGVIRLSDRLRAVPGWVLDCVLVHELAHLAHHDHGPAFSELADRHPRQAEASVFLEGYQLGLDLAADRLTGASSEPAPLGSTPPTSTPPTSTPREPAKRSSTQPGRAEDGAGGTQTLF